MTVQLSLKFDFHDLWLGVYWKRQPRRGDSDILDFYICLLPTLPLHIRMWRTFRPYESAVRQTVKPTPLQARVLQDSSFTVADLHLLCSCGHTAACHTISCDGCNCVLGAHTVMRLAKVQAEKKDPRASYSRLDT